MEELIDPPTRAYAAQLSRNRINYIPGAGAGVGLSAIARQVGLPTMLKVQRSLLTSFGSFREAQSAADNMLASTLETLIGLVTACLRKEIKLSALPNTPLRNGRRTGFCKFCGELAEYTAVSAGVKNFDFHPENETGEDKTLRLSADLCEYHRPRFPDGRWNPAHQTAKRSFAQFELELLRFSRQSARLQLGQAQSGNAIVDAYIFLYVRKYGFQPADEAELRDHARLMVDRKLSDQKKKIVVLRKLGLSQQAIATEIGVESRQAVSKALAAISDIFFDIPIPKRFSLDSLGI
ncbi:LuxR family transcriptional regulator [Frateuria aurantia]